MPPGLIADAIFSGHLAVENFETHEIEIEHAMHMREMPSLKYRPKGRLKLTHVNLSKAVQMAPLRIDF